jgi:hypothetical protein
MMYQPNGNARMMSMSDTLGLDSVDGSPTGGMEDRYFRAETFFVYQACHTARSLMLQAYLCLPSSAGVAEIRLIFACHVLSKADVTKRTRSRLYKLTSGFDVHPAVPK